MKPISQADIDQLYKEQKAFFASQKTLSVAFRKEQLRKLRKTSTQSLLPLSGQGVCLSSSLW